MKKIIKINFLLGFIVLILLIISGSFLLRAKFFEKESGVTPTMAAGSPGNVSGFAWGENFGWVSLNSNDCDTDKNGFIDTNAMVNGCGGNNSTTVAFPYGVNLDTASDELSGYAWTENLGWLYFGPDATLAGYGSIASSSAPATPKNWAKVDSNSFITGWAKVLNLGNDGWVKFSDATIPTWNATGAKLLANGNDSIFDGWAWGGDKPTENGLGWLSFNCQTGGATGNNICASSNYKVTVTDYVVNIPPVVTNPASDMTAPNWSKTDACSSVGALRANLVWKYTDANPGDTLSAYRVVLQDQTNGSSTDTGKCTQAMTGTGLCVINPASCSGQCQYPVDKVLLAYNHRYTWSVQVWDSRGGASALVSYANPNDTPMEVNDGIIGSFTTFLHEFPDAKFSWTPLKPSKDELVSFTDLSRVSTSGNFFAAASSTNAAWLWTFENAATANFTTPNPQNTFTSSENSLVTLKVTNIDGTNYSCSTSTTLNVNLKMPNWTETKPQ